MGGVFTAPGAERAELICDMVSLQGARKAPQEGRVGVELRFHKAKHCTSNGACLLRELLAVAASGHVLFVTGSAQLAELLCPGEMVLFCRQAR